MNIGVSLDSFVVGFIIVGLIVLYIPKIILHFKKVWSIEANSKVPFLTRFGLIWGIIFIGIGLLLSITIVPFRYFCETYNVVTEIQNKPNNNAITKKPNILEYNNQPMNDRIVVNNDSEIINNEANFIIINQVRLKGSKEWSKSIEANIGDVVEFQIGYRNTSGKIISDVMLQNSLPNNLEYINGSTLLKNANHPNGVTITSETLCDTGINIGGYTNNSNAFVKFEARIVNKTLKRGCNQLINWAKITSGDDTQLGKSSLFVKIE